MKIASHDLAYLFIRLGERLLAGELHEGHMAWLPSEDGDGLFKVLSVCRTCQGDTGTEIIKDYVSSGTEMKRILSYEISKTIREVTVDYLENLGPNAKIQVTIPAGTTVICVTGGMKSEWAVYDVPLLKALTGNQHDPNYRYCFVPDDCVESVANKGEN